MILLVTKGFSSPNNAPKPRKNCENGGFSTPLTSMKSCTVDRGCTPAPKDATKPAVFFRFFSRLSFDISIKNSVQRWSSDFQGLFRVKIRKMAQGSDDLSTLPLIPKTIGNRKRDCAWGCAWGKHHLRKSADRKAQISSVSGTYAFLICAFRSADFLRWCLFPKRNLTHNLFFYFQ